MCKIILLILFFMGSFLHAMSDFPDARKHCVAFLMAAHHRLGEKSPAHILPREIYQQILTYCKPVKIEFSDIKGNRAILHLPCYLALKDFRKMIKKMFGYPIWQQRMILWNPEDFFWRPEIKESQLIGDLKAYFKEGASVKINLGLRPRFPECCLCKSTFKKEIQLEQHIKENHSGYIQTAKRIDEINASNNNL